MCVANSKCIFLSNHSNFFEIMQILEFLLKTLDLFEENSYAPIQDET